MAFMDGIMPNKSKRIFVGFASAGASGIWSFTRVLKKKGYKIDFYGLGQSKFGMPVDVALEFSSNRFLFALQKMFLFFRILFRYDVWHLNCMEVFFWYPLNLLILKIFRKKIVLTFRGSEVRTHLDFLPESIYEKSKDWPVYYQKMRKLSRSLAGLRRKIRMKIFIWFADKVALTGPFLASSVSRYDKIIPYARDLQSIFELKTTTHKKNAKKIVILHAPTVPEVKGSVYIEKTLRRICRKYPQVEFQMPMNLKNEDLLKQMADADIIIDQLLVGWYGGQAVEAMALGKPVLSYIHEPYLNLVDFATEIPIVNSNIWTFDKDLEILINSSELREKLGKEGIAFVKKYHRPEKIADEYLKLYFE